MSDMVDSPAQIFRIGNPFSTIFLNAKFLSAVNVFLWLCSWVIYLHSYSYLELVYLKHLCLLLTLTLTSMPLPAQTLWYTGSQYRTHKLR